MFEKKEVYIHEPPKDEVNGSLMDANKIGGQLQILKNVSTRDCYYGLKIFNTQVAMDYLKKHGSFLRFLPYGCEPSNNEGWTFIIENSTFSYSKGSKEETGMKDLGLK